MSDEGWVYLGDGVYAKFDGMGIWLHANSHDRPTDRIYLELPVWSGLKRMAARWLGQKEGAEND